VVRANEPLAPHTSWRVGGPADLWLEPADEGALSEMVLALSEAGVPWCVLGKGSNSLVSDAGVRGAVLNLEAGLGALTSQALADGTVRVVCGGGASVASLLRFAAERDLEGVEMLTGVPGSVGGAVRMNAGTHLGECRDSLLSARVMDQRGRVSTRSAAELGFRYRGSNVGPQEIVVEATFSLEPAPPGQVAAVQREVKERRRKSQPLTLPSGGSTFENPPGHKAWQLIDAAGLRGAVEGGAQISPLHPNFIVNLGGATARDIAALIRRAQQEVFRTAGVRLHTEVCWLGDWPERGGP
jgi:UDP-N-acetylmuramate dehydrogenase